MSAIEISTETFLSVATEPFMLVIDTETTGLLMHPSAPLELQPRCIEFGAARLRPDGSLIDELEILIHPGKPLPAEIVKITGITDGMLDPLMPFWRALPRINAYCLGAKAVVAHNFAFDNGIIGYELQRMPEDERPPMWKGATEMCTVELFKHIWGRRPRLVELYMYAFDTALAQTHRAMGDVRALVAIIQKLKVNELVPWERAA